MLQVTDLDLQIEISSDRIQLDIPLIHNFLTNSYWAKGIDLDAVEKSIENSFCFGAYTADQQIGFGRLITDYTTFGYVSDVFVLEPYRGHGIARAMMDWLLAQPELKQMRRILLATKDAHPLYKSLGFSGLDETEHKKFMQIRPNRKS